MTHKHFNNTRGYTLMEVMVSVVVVGVLMSIAIPTYTQVIERSKAAEGVQILTILLEAQKLYQFETGGYTSTASLLEVDVTAIGSKHFNTPTVSFVASAVASITRSTAAYTLTIDEDGVVTCSGAGSICTQIGY